MTAAIASRHPDAEVSTVTLTTRDDGTNRRARFALEYARGTGPTSVFAKAHTTRHRWVHLRNGNRFNEARLFASGVDLLRSRHLALHTGQRRLPGPGHFPGAGAALRRGVY
jgi:hypothetical protein